MGTFNWQQYNPDISVKWTTKKYFGQYLYKIKVYAPCGRAILNNDPLDVIMDQRKDHAIRFATSVWSMRISQHLDQASIPLLECLRTVYLLPTVKMRVEEPYVQLYVSSEDELHDLISLYFAPSFLTHIREVYCPESDHAKTILDSNAIIRRTPMEYTHKVTLRDGNYGISVKAGLQNYLSNLGSDVVHVPPGVSRCFTKDNDFIWNAYFYTNDPSVTMFIDVIYPGLVLNCCEVIVLATK